MDQIKADFEKVYEGERKKKEFDKYYMLNKYAKQKKRRRNFSIDRTHHYDKILDEATIKKNSGFFKIVIMVSVLCALVYLGFKVRDGIDVGSMKDLEYNEKEENNKQQNIEKNQTKKKTKK